MLLSVVVLQVLHGWAHSVEVEHLRNQGHVIMSQDIDMCVQDACEGGISCFTVDKQGVLTCISVLKELCNAGSA